MTTTNETLTPASESSGEDRFSADLAQALAGASYPLRRSQLVIIARENEASSGMLTQLSALPDARFDAEGDVRRALFLTR